MTITLEQIILAQEDIKVIQKEIKLRQDDLEAMIKAYEEQQKEAEFPKKNDAYWFLTSDGFVYNKQYANSAFDGGMLSLGNCFRTKEDAEFAVEQLEVIAEMKRCGGVWKTKQNDRKEYYLRYEAYSNNSEAAVAINSYSHKESLPYIWFPTEEAAQKAIDTIGKERLLKYWFCVEV